MGFPGSVSAAAAAANAAVVTPCRTLPAASVPGELQQQSPNTDDHLQAQPASVEQHGLLKATRTASTAGMSPC